MIVLKHNFCFRIIFWFYYLEQRNFCIGLIYKSIPLYNECVKLIFQDWEWKPESHSLFHLTNGTNYCIIFNLIVTWNLCFTIILYWIKCKSSILIFNITSYWYIYHFIICEKKGICILNKNQIWIGLFRKSSESIIIPNVIVIKLWI